MMIQQFLTPNHNNTHKSLSSLIMPARTRESNRLNSSRASVSGSRTGHFGRPSNGRQQRPTSREEEEEEGEEESRPKRKKIAESSHGRNRARESQSRIEESDEDHMEEDEEEEEEAEGDDGEEEDEDDDSTGGERVWGLKPATKLAISEAMKKTVNDMDKEKKDGLFRKANDLARLALFSELRRTPLRRNVISEKILKGDYSRLFPVIFNRAQKILRRTFGYEMKELRARGTDHEQIILAQTQTQRRRETQKGEEKDIQTKSATSKSYVLVSLLPNKLISQITQPNVTLGRTPDYTIRGKSGNVSGTEGVLLDWKRSNADLGKTGLTMLILALILVNNRVMPEDQLRFYLRRMGLKGVLPESLQSFPELSSGILTGQDSEGIMLDDYLTNLVKHEYLERSHTQMPAAISAASMDASMSRRRAQARGNVKRTRIGQSDIVEDMEFRWGSRAEAEIGETAVASFIADISLKMNDDEFEGEDEDETRQSGGGNVSERRKKRREQILREVQRAAGSSLVV